MNIVEDYQENYSNGWIKLYRSIQKHWIWQDPVKLKWWIDILLSVNHSGRKINIGYEIFDCAPGQTIMSLQNWGFRWNVSKDTVRNFFTLLKKDKMILTENLKKTTRLTVCNYVNYQCNLHDEQTTALRLPYDKQTQGDPNKNDKKEKNDNNDKNINSEKFNFKNSFLDLGVNEEILNDWMEVRKKKKASNTKTAYTKFINQVNLSGITVNECVQICAEKDWKGFEAEWLNNLNYKSNGQKKTTNYTITPGIEESENRLNFD